MISLEDHRAACLAAVSPLPPVEVALLDALGCVLAEDVDSPVDLPGFDNSAMDGYAVTVADVAAASETAPVRLPVSADVPAGSTARTRLDPGHAVRIMTGAPVPDGAETVVQVELTDGGVDEVEVRAPAPPGQHVRLTGSDVRTGDVVLRAGVVIGPAQVALLAAVGRDRVVVHPRPRVAVVSTGSELVAPGTTPGFGEVVDSNGVMLTAAALGAGAAAYRVGPVVDEADEVLRTLHEQLEQADLVITSGGVSAGAYDTVKEVLAQLGTVTFTKVAMQPGMPQGFGVLGEDRTPIFTLPGNPVSSYVSFEAFVRPALRRMAGHRDLERPETTAVAVEGWSSPAAKVQLARGELGVGEDGGRVVRLVGGQGSYVLGGLARATCLVVVPAGVGRVEAGDEVRCIVLDGSAL